MAESCSCVSSLLWGSTPVRKWEYMIRHTGLIARHAMFHWPLASEQPARLRLGLVGTCLADCCCRSVCGTFGVAILRVSCVQLKLFAFCAFLHS